MASARNEIIIRWYGGAILTEMTRRAQSAALAGGAIIQQQAQKNVAPGRGPGPHPHHSLHIDTGNLMRDIYLQLDEEAKFPLAAALIGHTQRAYYGLYLELGWHTKAGNFYRYPWLMPAATSRRNEVVSAMSQVMRTGHGPPAPAMAARYDVRVDRFRHLTTGRYVRWEDVWEFKTY